VPVGAWGWPSLIVETALKDPTLELGGAGVLAQALERSKVSVRGRSLLEDPTKMSALQTNTQFWEAVSQVDRSRRVRATVKVTLAPEAMV
jgi:hypothetical protein